jgi:hypothetical protein
VKDLGPVAHATASFPSVPDIIRAFLYTSWSQHLLQVEPAGCRAHAAATDKCATPTSRAKDLLAFRTRGGYPDGAAPSPWCAGRNKRMKVGSASRCSAGISTLRDRKRAPGTRQLESRAFIFPSPFSSSQFLSYIIHTLTCPQSCLAFSRARAFVRFRAVRRFRGGGCAFGASATSTRAAAFARDRPSRCCILRGKHSSSMIWCGPRAPCLLMNADARRSSQRMGGT